MLLKLQINQLFSLCGTLQATVATPSQRQYNNALPRDLKTARCSHILMKICYYTARS